MSVASRAGMAGTMAACLDSAGMQVEDVDYVNAHATGTLVGDAVEAQATADIFGERVPVSSTKGFTGHTLAACGAIEAIFSVLMMHRGFLVPTRNLDDVDPACRGVPHGLEIQERPVRRVLSNSFALGGVNASLMIGQPQ